MTQTCFWCQATQRPDQSIDHWDWCPALRDLTGNVVVRVYRSCRQCGRQVEVSLEGGWAPDLATCQGHA
ncbi:MAG: hypothetical protein JWL64_2575 [Frankiales bacterium]|nr:hypothetical protein [Frankiales bacterium]